MSAQSEAWISLKCSLFIENNNNQKPWPIASLFSDGFSVICLLILGNPHCCFTSSFLNFCSNLSNISHFKFRLLKIYTQI